jgi:hypothetical protein
MARDKMVGPAEWARRQKEADERYEAAEALADEHGGYACGYLTGSSLADHTA